MANESKLESELRKAVGSIRALRNEKDKIASQLELCLTNAIDQEQSAILRVKFSLEREVCYLHPFLFLPLLYFPSASWKKQ